MQQTLTVKKMHCKSCEILIKDALADLGVTAVVSVANKTVKVDFDSNKTSLDQIKKAIRDEGYEVQ